MKNALAALLAGSLLSAHASALTEAAATDGAWILLIPAGTFSGRDGRGPYHAGDRTRLETIAAQTRSFAGPLDLVIDYEHQSINALENGKPAPAAGWIKEVQARDDGLYGRVEWTANASAAIVAKEYRYLSPVYFHTEAGDILALQNAGLTNNPNLHMAEVSAHSVFRSTNEVPMKNILAALGLADGASEADVLTAINSLLTSSTAIAVAAGLTKDAAPAVVLTAVNSAFADRKAIATATGKAESAAGDELVTAVRSAMTMGAPDPTKFVPIEQVSAMQTDLKALKDRMAAGDADAEVGQAIKDGKLAPALKDWGISMHKADPAAFKAFVENAPVLTSAQRTATANPPKKEEGDLSEHHRRLASAMGIDPKEYAKTLAAEAAAEEND
ncbi:phage protease [Pararhizobium sp.]|uniref:phage protease n=1 Tax=Pararhizobium sp. TaxID=1977563 RepID=UPI003D11BC41